MHVRKWLSVTLLLGAVACGGGEAGPMGPPGPQGPQGPQGPPGPAGPSGAVNRFVLEGQVGGSGGVTGLLPPAAVANGGLPAIACYISSNRNTWLAVAQTPATSSGTYCGLTGVTSGAPGITLVNAPTGWFYYLVAVY